MIVSTEGASERGRFREGGFIIAIPNRLFSSARAARHLAAGEALTRRRAPPPSPPACWGYWVSSASPARPAGSKPRQRTCSTGGSRSAPGPSRCGLPGRSWTPPKTRGGVPGRATPLWRLGVRPARWEQRGSRDAELDSGDSGGYIRRLARAGLRPLGLWLRGALPRAERATPG